ncbi:mechanosensitive ion channel domain-containing protein [Geitlerinema sp. PCC 9228]|jgi:small-conductance mechanosensitive channel|uniref:mechanosensitive ion channel family protein n=1 Tax=Geitlerinema sp. PCC 9228 TaxID=111611 RepID=UPI000A05C5BC|nr:mechanosensitive ion channel domain-containing protein [Geitlerinema sp. PCC 9228]
MWIHQLPFNGYFSQVTIPSFWEIPAIEIPPFLIQLFLFVLFAILSIIIGKYTPGIVTFFVHRLSPQQVSSIYDNLINPIRGRLKVAGTLILISWSLTWISQYTLYALIKPFMDLAVIVSMAWLASGLFRQFVRSYALELLKKLGREVDELLLVFETVANILIGFFAALVFAQSQDFNLIGLMASLGIGGLAVALAARTILEQLLSTIVLYLDRPFVPGDYIRLSNGELGRIESIGLRSTKIRTSGKSTMFVVPNSNLVNSEIENITRAKKIMVMLYMDFNKRLSEQDRALVQQVVSQSTDSVFGIDPGSTNMAFKDREDRKASTARVSFFILGSSENSIQLRKRLLELANQNISEKLQSFGIEFVMKDPTIYVESQVTL